MGTIPPFWRRMLLVGSMVGIAFSTFQGVRADPGEEALASASETRPSPEAGSREEGPKNAPPESRPAEGSSPDFRAYIFWAYGLACAVLFALTVWTALGVSRLQKRMEELSARLQKTGQAR